jgi:hydrogenase nickel incorporation protein HypA/HybF
MHEFSIMESTLSLASEQARLASATRVFVLRMRVGALSSAVPEALQLAFEALSPGSPLEGAELVIESVPARFFCENCRQEFVSDRMISECPGCQQSSRDIRGGRELELVSIEVE